MRSTTRRERYLAKTTCICPVSVFCVNFSFDPNVAFIIRSAACFGVKNIYILGNTTLKRKFLNALSGSSYDYMNISFFSYPEEFIDTARTNNIKLVSLELPGEASGFNVKSIFNYKFNFSKENCLVVGNEKTGVPIPLLNNSDIVYIPMNGQSYCMNVASCASVALYEFNKQFYQSKQETQ